MANLADAAASLQQLLDAEAAAPLLGEGAVFAALPLRLLGAMLAEVRGGGGRELLHSPDEPLRLVLLLIMCLGGDKRALLISFLLQVHSQHRDELAVKAGVLQGCQQIVGERACITWVFLAGGIQACMQAWSG